MNTTITNHNRKSAWNPIQELRSEMDRLFDGAWSLPLEGEAESSNRTWQPACDVVEDQEHYLLSLEMAGIPKDQIQIEVVDQNLIVTGERKYEDRKKQSGVMYSERRYGKFQRTFSLPLGLDLDKIEANHEDGVLRILVPKTEAVKPRRIKIEGGSSTGFFGKLISQASSKEKEAEHSFTGKDSSKAAS